ncbi:hypothetical protein [Gemmiger qucibialis]|uniref:hypothetical protein n=1 Tax=Gemmiger qucibialis TaxID=2997294 RepID=UPI0022E4A831|nr:hypothetical protein [Gemmiger qucibialis]
MLDKTSSIICAFGLATAAPRSPYRHLELCGIALSPVFQQVLSIQNPNTSIIIQRSSQYKPRIPLRKHFLCRFYNVRLAVLSSCISLQLTLQSTIKGFVLLLGGNRV